MQNKIKIVKLTMVLMFLAAVLFGQEEQKEKTLIVGVHGAPAGALLLGGTYWTAGKQPILAFIAGGSIQYNLSPRCALQAELNYERKGYIGKYNFGSSNLYVAPGDSGFFNAGLTMYSGFIKIKQINDYITLPLTVKFNFSKKKIALFTNVGIYTAYLIRSGYSIVPVGEPFPAIIFGNLKGHHQINFGLVTGLGINVPIKEHLQFSMEVRNNLKFGNIFRWGQDESFAFLFGMAYKL